MRAVPGAAALLVLAVAGCGGGGDDGGSGDASAGRQGGPLEIEIVEVNGSGEAGIAELTPNGAVTDILISTTGASGGVAGGVPNPAGIYKGTCDKLAATPAYKLPTLEEGISATTIDVSLDELLNGYAINVLRSAKDKSSVACGEIKEPE